MHALSVPNISLLRVNAFRGVGVSGALKLASGSLGALGTSYWGWHFIFS